MALVGRPEEALGLHRAWLTVIWEAKEAIDGGYAAVARVFQKIFDACLKVPWRRRTRLASRTWYADIFELLVWAAVRPHGSRGGPRDRRHPAPGSGRWPRRCCETSTVHWRPARS